MVMESNGKVKIESYGTVDGELWHNKDESNGAKDE